LRLFGTAGIRGPIVEKVTPELGLKLGLSLATFLGNRGTVATGYDPRTSSPLLESSLLSGLLAGGCDVAELGLVAIPVLSYFCAHSDVDGGVMVTASHNSPEDNGFKCLTSEGMEYVPSEEETLEALILNGRYRRVPWNKIGKSEKAEGVTQSYIDAARSRGGELGKKPFRVVVDCANGAAYEVAPKLLQKMGCEILILNGQPDGHFPGRLPEPKPENLGELMKTVVRIKADLGVAYDSDADRVAIIDEHGKFLNYSRVIALFSKEAVKARGGGTVITSSDTSFCVDEAVEGVGGRVERTRIGQIHVPLRARRDIIFSGEPWKLMDPSWGPWTDGIYSTARLIRMLSEKKVTVFQLFSEIPEYPWARLSTPCPDELKPSVMAKIKEALSRERRIKEIWTFDGLRLNYEDRSWLLIRPSGTQPLIKIYCEARTRGRLKALINLGMQTTKGAVKQARSQGLT